MRLVSWNVNGIRAAARKGFLDWMQRDSADIVCVQETKAMPEQLDEALLSPQGYTAYYSAAERKGYSGTAIFAKEESLPLDVKTETGIAELDGEGRIVIAEYVDFYLFNVYFPNGRASKERLEYKLKFYDAFLEYVNNIRKTTGRGVIICGDYNTAHQEIDLARPKENSKTSGFLPIEREWIDRLIDSGFTDSFRMFSDEPQQYTWWDMRTKARERNAGWRLDYFFVSEEAKPLIKSASIEQDVFGSDHCPIGLELDY